MREKNSGLILFSENNTAHFDLEYAVVSIVKLIEARTL